MGEPRIGTVYLLHFDRPYHHARHYIGFTRDLARRTATHRAGKGSPLIQAASRAGITFTVARVWDNVTVRFERRLHNRSPVSALCPLCVGHGKLQPGRPRISDYQEIEYEEDQENLEYHGHWEYQPLEEPWRESPYGPD
jgi:predicted GIY-YIG superfamily endonuclease